MYSTHCQRYVTLPENPSLILGTSQAYNYSEDQSFRNGGSGTMLGGLGLTLFLWIIHAIYFAIFSFRYFRDREIITDNRVRAICLALFINIITLTVYFSR